jgi:hypothetical protein
MSRGCQILRSAFRDTGVQQEFETTASTKNGSTRSCCHEPARVGHTRSNVLTLQPGIFGKYFGLGVAGFQHAKHMLDRQAAAADDGLSSEDTGVDRYPIQQVI